MLNIASSADILENTVVYQLEKNLPLTHNSRQSIESNLARRGLMVGLAMQGNKLQLILMGNLNQKSSALFKEFMGEVLHQGYTDLICDMTNLQIVDGSGVASLVWIRNELLEKGGQLTVTNLSRKLRISLLAINFQYLVNIADYDYR